MKITCPQCSQEYDISAEEYHAATTNDIPIECVC